MALTRNDILARIEERRHEVERADIPELGGTVCLRRLSAADAERTGITAEAIGTDPSMIARVIAACAADENGEPLFTEEDVARLMQADVIVTAKLFAECIRVNGMMSDDLEAAVSTFANAQHESSSSS